MIQSYGGIFTILVLTFQTTLACVKGTETTQNTQSPSLWPRETCNLRSFTGSPPCPTIHYSRFYLVTMVHLSNLKYL